MLITRLVGSAFAFGLASVGLAAQGDSIPPPPAAIARANFDTSCAPCKDFYRYVNGAWLDRTAIPPQFPEYGIFREIQNRTEALLRSILNQAALEATTTADPTTRRIGTFYRACMDTARIESAGLSPLLPRIRQLDSLRDRRAIMAELGALQRDGVDAGVPIFAVPGLHNSSITALYLYQGGLGLPDRDFYLRADTTLARIRSDYQAHLGRLLALASGTRHEDEMAAQVMAIETALARAAQPAQELREITKIDHPMSGRDLQRLAPGLDWPGFFHAVGVAAPDTMIVATPPLITLLDSLVRSAPLEAWRAYLKARLLETVAEALHAPFQREHLALLRLTSGETELRPRWQRCVIATDGALGEALGQAYVARAFTPQAKARALELVQNLRAAMADRLRALTWMSDSTKRAALAKLAALTTKIGYPDRWRDYSALEIAPDLYVLNVLRARRFETARQLTKVGKAVDRAEWVMTPPTLDAYSNPLNVEIVFPAGILQPPFFDATTDDAVNYGAIGAVIGHEITHEFDDQGRMFDAKGNLVNWWTSADSAEFVRRAALIARQYSGYVAVDTLHVNGQLTLGENIADIGGLIIAHDAWRRSLQGKPEPAPIDGFTAEQRFFLAWASGWREKIRPETLRSRVLSNPHSPPMWRVDGVVQHLAAFQMAFGCHAGDPMYRPPEERMQIW
jgi:putative endopeptidase